MLLLGLSLLLCLLFRLLVGFLLLATTPDCTRRRSDSSPCPCVTGDRSNGCSTSRSTGRALHGPALRRLDSGGGSFAHNAKAGYETRPAGNAVNLEDEMLKVSANQMDYAAATSLYSRSLGLGSELAARFELDQAALRAESGLFLDPQDLAGLAEDGCEVANHTRSHLFCRAFPDEEAAYDQIVENGREHGPKIIERILQKRL